MSQPSTLAAPAGAHTPSNITLSRPETAVSVPLSQTSSTVGSHNDDPEVDDDDVNSEFHREAYGPEPGEKGYDKYEVRFEADDPASPYNWSRVKRWYITLLGGVLVLNAYVDIPAPFSPRANPLHRTFASSAPSGIVPQMMETFHFGREVATLTIALFVGGYCVGPLLWGPLSESYGRKLPMVVAFFVYTCFQVGCALAPNTGAILVFRFLGGTFAAAPLVISG